MVHGIEWHSGLVQLTVSRQINYELRIRRICAHLLVIDMVLSNKNDMSSWTVYKSKDYGICYALVSVTQLLLVCNS